MNKANMAVLTNIIGAVETGGQVYGRRRYDDYTAPYTNTPNEHTVTLGWPQFYGEEARALVRKIFEMDRALFRSIDKAGAVKKMLGVDWAAKRWNPGGREKKVLVALIDSETGHMAQDALFAEQMEKFIRECAEAYTGDVRAQMMYCEIRHLGGKSAVDRIFKRCRGKYGLAGIMAALKKDQEDTGSDNQVGDRKFWSRHEKCREFVEKYAVEEGAGTGGSAAGAATGNSGGNGGDLGANADGSGAKKGAGAPAGKGPEMTALQRAKVLLRQPKNDTMTGYTPEGKGCFAEAGAFSKNPKKGDVIYFYSSAKGRVGHVGIVERVDSAAKVVHTVEGNTSSPEYAENGGCVARHSYSYAAQGGTNRVNGFGRPDFERAGVTADQFVETAVSFLGYLEKRSNAQLDSRTANAGSGNYQRFQRNVGAGNGDQWCQYFVDAVALYTCQGTAGSAGGTAQKGGKPKKVPAADVMTAAVKGVVKMAGERGWTYGDSHSAVPCEDRKISCDRLIARALYEMGFRDQRDGGETCGTLDAYLTAHGWTKVTKKSQIRAGAVVAVKTKGKSSIDHVFYAVKYDKAKDICTKYDTGSDARIRAKQPFQKVPLVEWGSREFACAWNCPGWLCSGVPGRFVKDGVDYAPVFNSVYYRRMNPDVAKACGRNRQKLFEHFLRFGMDEGRQGCAGFDVRRYKEREKEKGIEFGTLGEYYTHYCESGGV